MRRSSLEHDVEAPLLGGGGGGGSGGADTPCSRCLSPNRALSDGEEGRRTPRMSATHGGSIRLKRAGSSMPQVGAAHLALLACLPVHACGSAWPCAWTQPCRCSLAIQTECGAGGGGAAWRAGAQGC